MASSVTNRLPAEVTSFVGRREDLGAVRRLFTATRLVTLTGPGGVGKTRLALRVARELERDFPGGVRLAELGHLTDPGLLGQAVVDALGMRAPGTADTLATLESSLQGRQALLVLDGCEHMIDTTAELATALLRSAPHLRILATSRQSLGVMGEHIHPVEPFQLPDPDSPAGLHETSVLPAVQLFVDRTVSVVPGFSINAENANTVVHLCRRLEGMPLAIELAAVRLRVLTVDELVTRLDDRFTILRSDTRNLPERHRTLASLIGWSFDLCSASEQLLWMRAAVFAGSVSAEALTAVCTDDALPAEDLLDSVAGLVEKSILIRDAPGAQVRFRMLDSLREYGRRRLDAQGDAARFTRRQRDWCTALVERVTQEWNGDGQEEWAVRFQLDHANLRIALEYCMTTPGEAQSGLRMVGHSWFWGAMDHLHEASIWLDRGLALDQSPSPARAWAIGVRGYIAAFQGERDLMETLAHEAIALARQLDDLPSMAMAHHVLGWHQSLVHGDAVRNAIPLFLEARRRYDELGPEMSPYLNSLLVELAATHLQLRQFDEASSVIHELTTRCRTSGDRWSLSYAMWLRGRLFLAQGHPDLAEAELLDALVIKRVFRDTIGLALIFEVLAWTAATSGDFERAATLMGATDRIWREMGGNGIQMHGKSAPHLAAARRALGSAAFEAARERGDRLRVEDTIAFILGEDAASPSQRDVPPETRLTRRENQVARLVAQGFSNREIATTLVISPRTAEGHVERVLTKLGFRTRAQIASWATARDSREDQ